MVNIDPLLLLWHIFLLLSVSCVTALAFDVVKYVKIPRDIYATIFFLVAFVLEITIVSWFLYIWGDINWKAFFS